MSYIPKSVITEELLTIPEVARALRVDDTTVRRWGKNGAIEVVILPHPHKRLSYRIKKSTLEAILAGKLPK
jgi:excisionase family DNA binding protein